MVRRYDSVSVRARQSSVEVAAVLLDAHTKDQAASLQLLLAAPARYTAEDAGRATALYRRTYSRHSTDTEPSSSEESSSKAR